ncbi:hypothetical protein [Acetobacter indonesiensis]|uniref:Uncharacterized protein n=1 Tax=Acetobacter indonesiensis TaxID=104101 RepID=A0A252AM11_9PROT|nr:hypothetical protein [Acetobacter indonesiensis]OUI90751.1 hypothetical protein HK17_13460 [Acetobacter indonesiensis]
MIDSAKITVENLIKGAENAAKNGEISGTLLSNVVEMLGYSDTERVANPYIHEESQGGIVEDSEVRRLEDRIDSVNREGQLRLDAAMARIDGKFDTMITSMQHMEQSISQSAERISGMKSIIIGTAIATVIAIVGAVFAGQALWASGFSSGQTDRPAVVSAPNAPTH